MACKMEGEPAAKSYRREILDNDLAKPVKADARIVQFLAGLPWGQFYTVRKLIFDYAVVNLKEAMVRENCAKVKKELLSKARRRSSGKYRFQGAPPIEPFSSQPEKVNEFWYNHLLHYCLNTHLYPEDEDYKGGCYSLVPSTKRVDPRIVSIPPTGKYNPIMGKRTAMVMTMPVRQYLDAQEYDEDDHNQLMALVDELVIVFS